MSGQLRLDRQLSDEPSLATNHNIEPQVVDQRVNFNEA
jgi:hypothetical protein